MITASVGRWSVGRWLVVGGFNKTPNKYREFKCAFFSVKGKKWFHTLNDLKNC